MINHLKSPALAIAGTTGHVLFLKPELWSGYFYTSAISVTSSCNRPATSYRPGGSLKQARSAESKEEEKEEMIQKY